VPATSFATRGFEVLRRLSRFFHGLVTHDFTQGRMIHALDRSGDG